MTAAIPPAIAPRIGALLRMLGSDHDGEALGAARALQRTLGGAGLDLHALADAVERPAVVVPAPARRPRKPKADRGHIDWPAPYRAQVSATLQKGLMRFPFNAWEREFVESIIGRLRSPRARLTFKQGEVAERLVAKVEHGR